MQNLVYFLNLLFEVSTVSKKNPVNLSQYLLRNMVLLVKVAYCLLLIIGFNWQVHCKCIFVNLIALINHTYLHIHIHTCTHTYIPTLNKVRASRPSSQISSGEHICNLKGSDGRLTEQQKFYKFGFLKHLIFIRIRNVMTFEYIGNSLQGKV